LDQIERYCHPDETVFAYAGLLLFLNLSLTLHKMTFLINVLLEAKEKWKIGAIGNSFCGK